MTQQQIAFLELALVAGIGLVLFIAGVLIKVSADRKNGDGRIAPVVEYEAAGKKFTCAKRFNGVIKVHSTRLDEPDAWEDEKGFLHVRTGIVSDMRQLAQRLWPVGSELEVCYDPGDPRIGYVGKPVSNSFLCRVFLIAGAGVAALGILLYFLILKG